MGTPVKKLVSKEEIFRYQKGYKTIKALIVIRPKNLDEPDNLIINFDIREYITKPGIDRKEVPQLLSQTGCKKSRRNPRVIYSRGFYPDGRKYFKPIYIKSDDTVQVDKENIEVATYRGLVIPAYDLHKFITAFIKGYDYINGEGFFIKKYLEEQNTTEKTEEIE